MNCNKERTIYVLEEYRLWISQLEAINQAHEETIQKEQYVEKLLAAKGVESVTSAEFITELGNINCSQLLKQIQKYVGFEIVENRSIKHEGRTRISKRGRRKLRKILY